MCSIQHAHCLRVALLAGVLAVPVSAQSADEAVLALLGADGARPVPRLAGRLVGGERSQAAKAEVLAPVAAVKYLFNTPADRWRPYVALGAAYAVLDKGGLELASAQALALGPMSSPWSASWAPVYSAGLVYQLSERVSLNALVAYLPFKSPTPPVAAGGGVKVSIRANSNEYVLRLSYQF